MALYDINGSVIAVSGDGTVDISLLYNYTKWNRKELVVDGNSLTAVGLWGENLASFLGMHCTNLGRSGQSLIYGPYDKNGDAKYPYVWNMDTVKLRVANDYPDNADLIILQGDTNFNMDGEASDQMDGDNPKDTWTAKVNYLIRCIRAKYPNVIIVLIPDQVRYDGGVDAYTIEKNRTAYMQMKAIADYNRLAFYSVEHATPFNPLHDNNYYGRLYQVGDTQDYIHAAGTGGNQVYGVAKGKALAEFIAQLIYDPDAPNAAVENWQSAV